MTLDDALETCPIVAILRGVKPEEAMDHAEVLFRSGIRAIEVPLNSPGPFESIARMVKALGEVMAVGGGTVVAPADVTRLAEVGAGFLVSPNSDPEVIAKALAADIHPAPGFATATEAFGAIKAGARDLKFFPAGVLGAAYLKQVKAVLPRNVRIWAVGAVGPDDLKAWRAAGAFAFGLGGELYRAGQTPEETFQRAQAAIQAVRQLNAEDRVRPPA